MPLAIQFFKTFKFLTKNCSCSILPTVFAAKGAKGMDVSSSMGKNESHHGEKLIYPAATRNQDPIFQVLKRIIKCETDTPSESGPVFLEIASGSGQHLAYFGPRFPGITFQPTEVDDSLLGSINYYARNCATKNIKPPILLDICKNLSEYGFAPNSIDYIYNANMIHISPYACTIGLFENAGEYLKPGGLMITYGPYSQDGIIVPVSNVQFHASLLSRDPRWGLRDVTDLVNLGKASKLALKEIVEMPANNKILLWEKALG